MIRPLTFITLLLAAASGVYLYQTKHRARLLDLRIEQTLKQAAAAHERIGLLRAEWALLNEPDRLQRLAGQYLNLQPLTPSQFVSLADLGSRLPAIAPPAVPAQPTPAQTVGPAPELVSQNTQPTPVLDAPAAEASAAPHAVDVAARKPTPRTMPQVRPAPHPVQVARTMPHDAPRPWAARKAARHTVLAPVLSAFATPMAPSAPRMARFTRIGAVSAPTPYVGSALGGYAHAALPPPVPVRAN